MLTKFDIGTLEDEIVDLKLDVKGKDSEIEKLENMIDEMNDSLDNIMRLAKDAQT